MLKQDCFGEYFNQHCNCCRYSTRSLWVAWQCCSSKMHARCLLQIEAATNGYQLHRYFYEFKKITMMNAIVLLATVAVSFALKAPTVVPNTLAKVVFSPLPKVYVYDHCPFCGKHCLPVPGIWTQILHNCRSICREIYSYDDIIPISSLQKCWRFFFCSEYATLCWYKNVVAFLTNSNLL